MAQKEFKLGKQTLVRKRVEIPTNCSYCHFCTDNSPFCTKPKRLPSCCAKYSKTHEYVYVLKSKKNVKN